MKTVDVPSLGSVTVIKFHDQQQLGEGKGSFHFLTARSQSVIGGNQGRNSNRNLNAGTEAETIKGGCLLLAFQDSLSLLFVQPKVSCPAPPIVGWAISHQSLILPPQIPIRFACSPVWWRTISVKVPASQMSLVCIKQHRQKAVIMVSKSVVSHSLPILEATVGPLGLSNHCATGRAAVPVTIANPLFRAGVCGACFC